MYISAERERRGLTDKACKSCVLERYKGGRSWGDRKSVV